MNDEKPNNPEPQTGLIDRRFFLKKTSSAAAVIAVGGLIATSMVDNQTSADENPEKPAAAGDNASNKHWQAGWMAF